jgi:DNA-binding MurR/RpiR family transcriptional regulator
MNPPIIRKIGSRKKRLTRSEKLVAAYVSSHLRDLPFLTAAAIAGKVGVSEMTVGRFLRSLGYSGLDEVKRELASMLHHLPWLVGDRYQQFAGAAGTAGRLSASLDKEIKSLVGVYELARSPEFYRAAQMIAQADRVYVAGFQTVRGLASDFAQRLEYVRPDVQLLSGDNGTYAEAFVTDAGRRLLFLVDLRRYSKQTRLLAAQASEVKMPLIIVADSACAWAEAHAAHCFLVGCDIGTFWDSNAPITSLLNLFVDAVIDRLGASVGRRVEQLTRLQGRFDAFQD